MNTITINNLVLNEKLNQLLELYNVYKSYENSCYFRKVFVAKQTLTKIDIKLIKDKMNYTILRFTKMGNDLLNIEDLKIEDAKKYFSDLDLDTEEKIENKLNIFLYTRKNKKIPFNLKQKLFKTRGNIHNMKENLNFYSNLITCFKKFNITSDRMVEFLNKYINL